jgi:hypothetical protein
MDPVSNLTEAVEEHAELEESRGYIDLSQSRSGSSSASRNTAVGHLNKFLPTLRIEGVTDYNSATFDKDLVTQELFGKFCSYLLESLKITRYETASRYFSAVKTMIEEDFASQRLPIFTDSQKWYTKLRATLLKRYMDLAVQNNTRLTDSAPPLMEEVSLRCSLYRSAFI